MRYLFLVLAIFPSAIAAIPAVGEDLKLDHVVVSYDKIDKTYAEAIGRTIRTARAAAVEQFGFDMPQTISVEVTVDPQANVRLFTDGQDRFFLTVRSQQDLLKPATSGIFQLYGMCHEVGHLAMYRLIREHGWMTGDAAEGWAHYLGSRLVDAVHAKEGADLWPDRYDYLADGTKRLEAQLAAGGDDGVNRGTAAWKALAEAVGDKGIAPIFRAWGKSKLDPADPTLGLESALAIVSSDDKASQWWRDHKDVIVLKRPKSDVAAEAVDEKQLAGKPRELAKDNGKNADKSSIAGGGHAVRLDAPADGWYLTAVRIHGSRYGYPAPPKEDFHVWLCDKDFKSIADFSFPYAKFQKGPAKWVELKTKPTRVPREFIICVGFNPTATKGVFLSHDDGENRDSLTGLPGTKGEPFGKGNWLIRAKVAQRKGDGGNATPRVKSESTKKK